MKGGLWIALTAALAVSATAAQQPDLGTEAQRAAGKALYEKYCVQCHGERGDGRGIAAPRMKPRPRDFTSGKFKIRTTPSGALPTRADLARIIRVGMPYTTMPAWPNFTEQELESLIDYLETFNPDFGNPERVPTPIAIPEPPPMTPESVEAGRGIYEQLGCAGCHGQLGRGDGPSAPTLRDDWGQHIFPADLTKPWTFRGGPTRRDIFRAFSTGLNGTPMPSYAESLSEEQRWQLADYIVSLGPGSDPGYDSMVTAVKVLHAIDLEDEELFAAAAPAYFPVVGQITEPGREFYPSCNGIEVRAVYNLEEIAIELRWHDMRAETTGRNGPDLPVPRFEEDPYRGAAPEAPAEEGDFWGEETSEEDFWGEQEAAEEDFWGEERAATAATPDREFSDAVAIQFPLAPGDAIRKPYFIFGDKQNAVDLWFFDLAREAPEWFIGRGSDALESQGIGDLQALARYDRGEWRVVFKRPLRSPGGVPFDEGAFVPIAFSVWDGFNRERGNKRGLTTWYYLYLDPGNRPAATAPMLRAALAALLVELAVLALLLRRARQAPRRPQPAPTEQEA